MLWRSRNWMDLGFVAPLAGNSFLLQLQTGLQPGLQHHQLHHSLETWRCEVGEMENSRARRDTNRLYTLDLLDMYINICMWLPWYKTVPSLVRSPKLNRLPSGSSTSILACPSASLVLVVENSYSSFVGILNSSSWCTSFFRMRPLVVAHCFADAIIDLGPTYNEVQQRELDHIYILDSSYETPKVRLWLCPMERRGSKAYSCVPPPFRSVYFFILHHLLHSNFHAFKRALLFQEWSQFVSWVRDRLR